MMTFVISIYNRRTSPVVLGNGLSSASTLGFLSMRSIELVLASTWSLNY